MEDVPTPMLRGGSSARTEMRRASRGRRAATSRNVSYIYLLEQATRPH